MSNGLRSKWGGMLVVATVISSVSLIGAIAPISGQRPDPKQQDPKQEAKKPPQPQKPLPRAEPQKPQPPPQKVQPPPQKAQPPPQKAQPQRPQPQRPLPPPPPAPQQAQKVRLPQPQQQLLIGQQQQRLTQYGVRLDQQQRLASQQAVQLQRQNRTAQYGFQLQYAARLREQQLSIQNARFYDYYTDPYFYTPASYRYSRGGRYYQTNDYGAIVLREAVNYGYQQGLEAGQADRQDRWAFNYRDSYAYRDGTYGYRGFYIDRDEYNYYFRQGFRRGYDDGYYGRHQYGVYTTGHYSVQGGVLSGILNLQPLR